MPAKKSASSVYDVVIIGGGIASHTAALYTARANLKPLVIAGIEPDQLSTTSVVENYPGFPEGIQGPDLVQNCRKQAERFGALYVDANVDAFAKQGPLFHVGVEGKTYAARTVIIGTGASARTLGIPGEKQYFGRGVSTCAVCLPPDESIIVNSSIKKIKEVNPLTRVLTIDGSYQSIAGFNKSHFKGKLVKIRPRHFNEPVQLTPNHPVFSLKRIKDVHHGPPYYKLTDPEWVEARNLNKDEDCVLYPIPSEVHDLSTIKISDYVETRVDNNLAYPLVETHTSHPVKNTLIVDGDFMRLLGYYIAEGNSYKHMTSIYFNKNEQHYVGDVIQLLEKIFSLKPEVRYDKSVCRITLYSKIVADFFKSQIGSYAYNKKIPHWAMVLPPVKQKELVKGMWRGDGCLREEDFCYVTSSRELAYQLRDILLRLKIIPSLQVRNKHELNKHVNRLEGRLVGFNYDKYHVIVGGQFIETMSTVLDVRHPFLDVRKQICKHAWIKDNFAVLPIRSIDHIDYEGVVLNIGVENNNTYVAKNFVVHNCDAALFRNKTVAVIGGGDSAMEESLALYKFASKIYIVHRRDAFRASKIMQDRVLKLKDKIEVIWNHDAVEVKGNGKLVSSIKIRDVNTKKERELKVDGMFLAIGHTPNTPLFGKVIALDDHGYIITDKRSRTNVEGVYACGDVQDPVFKQAVTSAGTGCQAALEAERYLERLKAEGKY